MSEATGETKNKGGRPKGARTQKVSAEVALRSPEVQALIADAVALATAELTAKLEAKRAEHGTEASGADQSLMRGLALAIAEVSDQGTNRKRVPPAVLEARRVARDHMTAMILDYQAQDIMPEYELSRAVYLAEELVEPTFTDRDHVMRRTKIEWAGVPNEGMTPANDAARMIYGAFMESIGGATPNVTRPAEKIATREATGGLKVLHKPDVSAQSSPVSKPRNAGVTRLGRRQAGDVIETAVLGTVAEPARQLA